MGLDASQEKVLVVNPHDDDGVISAALTILAFRDLDVSVDIAVTTDGRQGYCDLRKRGSIVGIRKRETIAAYGVLGIPKEKIHFLGFPCSQMLPYQGRIRALKRDCRSPLTIQGAIGLQNSFTYLLRKIRPTIVIVPHSGDYHPDHKTTHAELLISIFHAMGDIWPELGPKLENVPTLWESVVYCNYEGAPPNLHIRSLDRSAFETKMEAIGKFASQPQIEPLIAELRRGSPTEVMRIISFEFYKPGMYDALFE